VGVQGAESTVGNQGGGLEAERLPLFSALIAASPDIIVWLILHYENSLTFPGFPDKWSP